MNETVNENLTIQIDQIDLAPSRPLVIVDADEVLLQFVRGLERFLERQNMYIDLNSYRLLGNICHTDTQTAIDRDTLKGLLGDFFAQETEHLDPVPGAADALNSLSGQAQIVVLTNIPLEHKAARADNLARHGMPYPIVSNQGLKDQALMGFSKRVDGPIIFLDDIPHHLLAAQKAVADCICIHLIGDPRLSALMTEEIAGLYRAQNWRDAQRYIENKLLDHNF